MYFGSVNSTPLAERLRPNSLSALAGQTHLTGEGSVLRKAIEQGRIPSMILWGPPGVGKTTIARLMAHAFDAQFISISAVLGGVKEIREAVELGDACAEGRKRSAGAWREFAQRVRGRVVL